MSFQRVHSMEHPFGECLESGCPWFLQSNRTCKFDPTNVSMRQACDVFRWISPKKWHARIHNEAMKEQSMMALQACPQTSIRMMCEGNR